MFKCFNKNILISGENGENGEKMENEKGKKVNNNNNNFVTVYEYDEYGKVRTNRHFFF